MDDAISLILCISIVAVVLIVAITLGFRFDAAISGQQQRKLTDARAQYERALELLRQYPDDHELRTAALQIGRIYADLTKGTGVFNETVLMNDLNAIPPTGHGTPVQSPMTKSAKVRLEELKVLFADELISEEEYEQRKKEILDSI